MWPVPAFRPRYAQRRPATPSDAQRRPATPSRPSVGEPLQRIVAARDGGRRDRFHPLPRNRSPPWIDRRRVCRLHRLAEPRQQQVRLPGSAIDSRSPTGSSQACVDSANVPQCTGISTPPPSRPCASSALAGPRWMSPHDGWNAPTSSITRSNGPSRSRIASYSVVSPGVAAEEDLVPLALDSHRRPQGHVAVLQSATRRSAAKGPR